jgi:hypothetical protein
MDLNPHLNVCFLFKEQLHVVEIIVRLRMAFLGLLLHPCKYRELEDLLCKLLADAQLFVVMLVEWEWYAYLINN